MDSSVEFAALRDMCPSTVVPGKAVASGYAAGKCSDGPLKCFEECKANNGGSCYALALLIEKNDDSAGDYPDRLHLRACELSIVSGCTNRAARMLEQYPDDKKIEKCTADTFEKTCSLEDPWGCNMYALALTAGKGREINLEEALKTAGKACKNGDEDTACQQSKKLVDVIKMIQKKSDPKPAGTP
jgi:TPR repeat protein